MRIGSSGHIDATTGGVAHNEKRMGAKGTIPQDKELAELDTYEQYQRRAYEASYWDTDDDWLKERQLAVPRTTDGLDELKVRRNRAEAWAIDRILARRAGAPTEGSGR